MRVTIAVLLGLVLGAAAANGAISASSRRAVKCAEAKIRAVKKKTDAKLTCQAIAIRKRTAVNPLCIARAEAKFVTAFARAEARGGCFNPNGESASRAESRVNEFIDDLGSLLIPCSLPGALCGPSRCDGPATLCVSDVSGAPVCADMTDCRQTCTSDAMCEPGRACVANRCCDICQ